MGAIHIPAELKQSIQQLADRLGFAKEDFVRDAISTTPSEIIAILHGARDADTILRTCLT